MALHAHQMYNTHSSNEIAEDGDLCKKSASAGAPRKSGRFATGEPLSIDAGPAGNMHMHARLPMAGPSEPHSSQILQFRLIQHF